jgi:LPS-assembly protein
VDRFPQAVLTSLLLTALSATAQGAGVEPPAEPQGEAAAYSPWDICPPLKPVVPADIPLGALPRGTTQVTAEEAVAESESRTLLRGNVVVQRDDILLQGKEAEYDRSVDRLLLRNQVIYHTAEVTIEGDSAHVFLGRNSGEILNARFLFPEIHAFGSADRISFQDPEHASLEGVRYTTCPAQKEDWLLRAKKLTLNRESNTGEAYHAVLSFMHVPFLYSPYLNFPLEGRKTGLLPPTYENSEKNGTDVSLPFYWNIAPNQDATITPRNISARGAMVQTEYRFLTEKNAGQLSGDYLSNDKLFGDDRYYLAARHSAQLGWGWNSALLYQRVSDNLYFDDLGGSQESSSQTHLERHFNLAYRNPYWNFLGRVQDFQTLTGTEPYRRLPQLSLRGQSPRRVNRPQFGLETEAVRFQHDTLVPTGNRFDLKPSVSLPLEGPAWYIQPKLAWRYSQYQLQDNPGGDKLSRSLPISSLDSGLYFERNLHLGKSPYVQTLEPRLYYLNVPYRDQNTIPVFDTALSDFSFGQMFRDNRFTGVDRQGDAHQLTVALSSRFIESASGRERFRAAIGQIHYLQDREVTLLPGQSPLTDRSSDIIGELAASPTRSLNLRVTDQWNPHEHYTERLNARLRYSPSERQIFGLSYRFDRTLMLRQADAVALWPLARQWRVIGRWNYDLENEKSLDTIAGLEYESCCWIVRLVGRADRISIDQELSHSLLVNLELKGLATLGKRLEDALGRDILGTY